MSRGSKIDRIELFHVDVPLATPFFPAWIPGYPQERLRGTLLQITTRDGLVGHALGAAFDRERAGLGEFIGPFLLGLDSTDLEAASERLRQSSLLGWSNAWMEVAFWDIAAKAQQVPLWQLLAERSGCLIGSAPAAVPAYASFAELRSPEVRAESIERAARIGFRAFKISLGGVDEAADCDQIRSARRVAGPELELMIHAHQVATVSLVEDRPRWDFDRALTIAQVAGEARAAWLQEPLWDPSWRLLQRLAAESPVPLAGGDVATLPELLRAQLDAGLYRVATPDVTFLGYGALQSSFADWRTRGIAFSPRSYLGGISLVANLHALAAWTAVSGQSSWLEFPWEPPAIIPELRDALFTDPVHVSSDGTVQVPREPGLGVELDPLALRRYAQRFYVLTPIRFVVNSARRSGLRHVSEFTKKTPLSSVGS